VVSDILVIRGLFVITVACAAFALRPFQLDARLAALMGVLIGLSVVLFEMRLRQVSLKRLIGGAAGSVLGIAGAFMMSMVIGRAFPDTNSSTGPFLQLILLLLMTYVGLVLGANKGELLNLSAMGGLFGGNESGTGRQQSFKVLDTSVIIDGRLADIAETGFLDGIIVIPQFVMRELQMVADSPDSLRRNRGRRGLDVLQRIQKMPSLEVKILEDDFPQVREVDLKLIEFAKLYSCKIVTNDFNLNKVAQLHGVQVLNINELANAMKAVVLPGESMRVFVLKEGKEYNQGVAYLDDGTMVVVDNARRMISKTIDITVTSMLQTTAGKMIFGRFDEKQHAVHPEPKTERAAAAAPAAGH
jgi:uncharacterized protein YacL